MQKVLEFEVGDNEKYGFLISDRGRNGESLEEIEAHKTYRLSVYNKYTQGGVIKYIDILLCGQEVEKLSQLFNLKLEANNLRDTKNNNNED